MSQSAQVFDADDRAYLDWVHDHPDGYVVNATRGLSFGSMVIHHATCTSISGDRSGMRAGAFTERQYVKICAVDLEGLSLWARAEGSPDGSFGRRCRTCFQESRGAADRARWDRFAGWARRVIEWERFEEEERDHKLVIASNLGEVKRAVDSATEEWFALLKRAFGSPNNLTNHFGHSALLRWVEQHSTNGAKALDDLWSSDAPPAELVDAFCERLPPKVVPGVGTRVNLISFLLMGRDVRDLPPYQFTVLKDGCSATNHPIPEKAAPAGTVYESALEFFDTIRFELGQRGLDLRDRLDAQSVLWGIMRNKGFLESLPQDLQAELKRYRKGRTDTARDRWWVFQCSPRKYDLDSALSQRSEVTWLVNRYANEIQVGDGVFLWASGPSAGIRAVATIISSVEPREIEDDSHVLDGRSLAGLKPRADLRIDRVVAPVLLRSTIMDVPELAGLAILKQAQGTNFPVTALEAELLNQMLANPVRESSRPPLNLILYGPPGTGKTYRARRLAVGLCDPQGLDDEDVASRYRELSRDGRIRFITFHQSFSYEDFVEGIRPETDDEGRIRYEPRDGIFKTICSRAQRARAKGAGHDSPDLAGARFWKVSLGRARKQKDDALYQDCIDKDRIRIGYGGLVDFSDSDDPDAIRAAYAETSDDRIDYVVRVVNDLKNRMNEGDIVLVSHALEGIRAVGVVAGEYERLDSVKGHAQARPVRWLRVLDEPVPAGDLLRRNLSQVTLYELKRSNLDIPALEQLLTEDGLRGPVDVPRRSAEAEPCVLIIDEINRANVSKVLGELITLLEEDKRLGESEEVLVSLPYSGSRFGVPPNLYVIGTMNTADRSLAALDVALRRRFEFRPILPDPGLVSEYVGELDGVDVADLLAVLNDRIAFLLDRDHTIGHAYFLKVATLVDLRDVFLNRLIPLLEEYFHGDWTKIALVLRCAEGGDGSAPAILQTTTLSADELIGTSDGEFDDAVDFEISPAFIDATDDELPGYFLAIMNQSVE